MRVIETEEMRVISGLKIVARLAGIVCFPVDMTEMCVTCQTRMMHVIESVTGNKPKALQMLILTFDTSATA